MSRLRPTGGVLVGMSKAIVSVSRGPKTVSPSSGSSAIAWTIDGAPSILNMPAMSEADALSYLLTGQAMGEGGGGQGIGVAAALQASGIGSVTAEVGRQLGLDELRVETGGDLAEASVVAGTWLSPRTYVQYVNELGTGETLLRLRYDLTRRIQIQTETGRAQGADIFYTFER